jgi:cation:H+ antiporter
MDSSNILVYILFVSGIFLLVYGADFLIQGSSSIARKFGIPNIIIGLTIVAFGTSLPEMCVNVISALKGNTDIAIGNVIGSNIANILLVLGLSAAIFPIPLKRESAILDAPFSVLVTLLLLMLANDAFIRHKSSNFLSPRDGMIMLTLFTLFMTYLIIMTIKHNRNTAEKKRGELVSFETTESTLTDGGEEIGEQTAIESSTSPKPMWMLGIMILGGLAALFAGGKWVVDGAVAIARSFGMSEFLISVTIIAIGTSLPELVTSAVAAFKKEPDISVGNVLGSNIFNILLILGMTSLIKPIEVKPIMNYDITISLVATVFLLGVMMFGKRRLTIDRREGAVMVLCYVVYITYVIIRG